MGYDFVFYCIRISRLFRTSLPLSLSLSLPLAVLIFVAFHNLRSIFTPSFPPL